MFHFGHDTINDANRLYNKRPSNMKESRLDDWQQFMDLQNSRRTIKMTAQMELMMDYCEYVIQVEFDKNTKAKPKYKKRKEKLPD